ncbi:phosphoglycerate kinase [Methanococcus voltae]|uniref:Phosphoglycerate kinase n=1 Tax=Methanococcus voltae PS TaxID=523842 RepID=A0ABT2EW10_METVO|nr:phosphoglycerate kinase [Methanococcus voltae]MBP2172171.1 phosphoglycerate kinase [Methanococcus voltae]MCS3921596.1 phosphoglycerate kinase [Methanococcus voltae PS]
MYYTIDDFDLKNKTVALRVDINSPIDPSTKEITDLTRIEACKDTICDLVKKGSKIVIIAHQSRPGKNDYISLEQHSKKLSEVLNYPVKFIDSIICTNVIEEIKKLESGEILMLENFRFLAEEVMSEWKKWENITPEKQANTIAISKLAPFFDYFINDAFAAAHRAQPSLVGFAYYMPMLAGRILEKELQSLNKALNDPEKPCVYAVGGAKADDSIEVIDNVLKKDIADKVLTSGIVANIFLTAKGYDIGANVDTIEKMGYKDQIDIAKGLLIKYGNKILTPVDVALNINNERVERELNEDDSINYPIFDMGKKTMEIYEKELKNARVIVANGPAGVFEDPNFMAGTKSLIESIANSEAFSIIGGGHLSAATEKIGLSRKIDHISTGGGACIEYLSGKKLPVIELLRASYEKYNNN